VSAAQPTLGRPRGPRTPGRTRTHPDARRPAPRARGRRAVRRALHPERPARRHIRRSPAFLNILSLQRRGRFEEHLRAVQRSRTRTSRALGHRPYTPPARRTVHGGVAAPIFDISVAIPIFSIM
jgi:hypothetical protein